MIKAFQDSINLHLPNFVTLNRLRATIVPKLSSFYDDNESFSPIRNIPMITDKQITTIQDTQMLEQFNKN